MKGYMKFVIVIILILVYPGVDGRYNDRSSIVEPQSSTWPVTWLQELFQAPFERQVDRWKKNEKEEDRTDTECDDPYYRRETLTLLYGTKFPSLFSDLRGQTKFEASGIEFLNETYFTIFDSLDAVGVTDDDLHRFNHRNKLVGDIGEEDSEFEGIAYWEEHDTFLLVKEAIASKTHEGFHPHFLEVSIAPGADDYITHQDCVVDFYIEHGNKGFEDIQVVKSTAGETFVLGLCEGNHCAGGKRGREAGNGRIVVLKEYEDTDANGKSQCKWECVKVIAIPGGKSEADFTDYSGMDMKDNILMIPSQEDSRIWFGIFNFTSMEIEGTLAVYNFPRSVTCKELFCNIEGVAWMDDLRIVAVSDKAKSRQDWSCTINDQSIHQFMLPKPLDMDKFIPYDPEDEPKLECLHPDAFFSATA